MKGESQQTAATEAVGDGMANPRRMDWGRAKRDALQLVADLPAYTNDMILDEYGSLLEALRGDGVRGLTPKQRAFDMQKLFPRFAVAYSSLFMMACHRDSPMPLAAVAELLSAADLQKSGAVSEGKARGMAMDVAEKYRRRRDS